MENLLHSTKDTLLITLNALICLLLTVHMYLRQAPLLGTLHKEKERHSSHPTSSTRWNQYAERPNWSPDNMPGTVLGI